MFNKVKQLFSSQARDAEVQTQLAKLRDQTPVPVFWLFGKTQSGKTTLVKFLTGAEEAEIGQGFRPCTRFSRMYEFPTAEAPLLTFLDTRGVDEPDYQADEDLARFDELAHVVVVTVKVMDHAQENVLKQLRKIREARPRRPIVLVLTCLHEAYPQQQHRQPYPFDRWPTDAPEETADSPLNVIPETLRRSLEEQRRRFADVVDHLVAVDLTKPEEGFDEPNYGGDHLKQVLLDVLPHAYRQTLLTLDVAMHDLQDLYARHALPHIIGYSTLAATAGAIPIPWIDLLILPGIQTRMIYHLARYYGQPMSSQRFLELASTLGMGMLARQAARELTKFIPYVGSVVSATLAGASTFALGKAFCYYYSSIHKGHVPQPEELRRYYQEQLAQATEWMKGRRE